MKKVWKKLVTVLLAAVLAVGILPVSTVTVSAASYSITVKNFDVTADGTVTMENESELNYKTVSGYTRPATFATA